MSYEAETPMCFLPEMEVFEGEMGFDYTSGLHSGSQNILLCGLVVRRPDPI